ncbi:MAG: LysE family translocator [Marinifilaceae bacterium]|jgi:threonine/homoserine/homoserine lactone efflux protein|nr:LysE family translocator [Marinifilaceae bacterium]
MDLHLILSFLGAAIILSFLPGPDNIYVLTESLSSGAKKGIAVSIGLCCGIMIHTIAASTGLSIIIKNSVMVFNIIKYLGAAYLLYLAVMSYKEKSFELDNNKDKKSTKTNLEYIKKGFLMNVLNPKVSLFFIALLPQFITNNGWNPAYQMIILGFVFMLQAFFIFSGIALLSGGISKYMRSPRFFVVTKWIKIVVLITLAIGLALSSQ